MTADEIQYQDNNGHSQSVVRILPSSYQVGDTVKMWLPNDGTDPFVRDSHYHGYNGNEYWRSSPWPRTQGTYLGYLALSLFAGACLAWGVILIFRVPRPGNRGGSTPEDEAAREEGNGSTTEEAIDVPPAQLPFDQETAKIAPRLDGLPDEPEAGGPTSVMPPQIPTSA